MPLDAGRIVKPAAKLRQLLRKARRRPLPDEIHDLRTNALRFEASIEALRSDASRSERRPLRDLAKVRSRAGKIRDMDVLTANAATLHADGEQDCVVRLLEGLGAERDKQARKLKTSLDKRVPTLRRRLKRSGARLERRLRRAERKRSMRIAADVLAQALTLAAELAAPIRLNRSTLHDYRRRVKELLYVLQMAADADRHQFVRLLGEVKDAIGEWHDWVRLGEIADETASADHRPQCALARSLKTTSDARYRHALSLTKRMRMILTRGLAAQSNGAGRKSIAAGAPVPTAITALIVAPASRG